MTKATIKSQNAIMTETAQNVVGAGSSRPRKNVNIALVCVGCTGGKTVQPGDMVYTLSGDMVYSLSMSFVRKSIYSTVILT